MKTNCFRIAILEFLPLEDLIEFYVSCCRVYINDQLGTVDNFPLFSIDKEVQYDKERLLNNIIKTFNQIYDELDIKTKRSMRVIRKVNPPTSNKDLARRRYTLRRMTADIMELCKVRFEKDFDFKKNNSIRIFDCVCCENYFRYTTRKEFKRMFLTGSINPQDKYTVAQVSIND